MSIINDRGEFGEMNGALNDYIETVKSLPDKAAATDLVKRVIGQPESVLESAITKYTNWIAAFNTKVLLLRDELEALMTG
jgi:carotenoid cleavage dioxygenase-like enzyme